MLVNLNVRKLGNDAVLVQYQEDGKAKDAAFPSWDELVAWLKGKVEAEKAVREGPTE